jgi:hypothetical protein
LEKHAPSRYQYQVNLETSPAPSPAGFPAWFASLAFARLNMTFNLENLPLPSAKIIAYIPHR